MAGSLCIEAFALDSVGMEGQLCSLKGSGKSLIISVMPMYGGCLVYILDGQVRTVNQG